MIQVPFGSICKLQNGRAFKPTEWAESGIPIVRIQNLNDETKPFNYCNFEVEAKFHVNSGDLLFSWSGTPGTSFGAFFWNRGLGILNQHIFRVDINETKVSKNYLYYAINSKLNHIIEQAHGGVGLKHITKGKLEAIEIPLPPLAEQKRIAAMLDNADSIRRKRQQAIQLADDFLRAVFLEMFGDPVTNPKGWVVKLLKDIAKIQIGPFGTQLHKEDYVSDGIPLINPSHIKNSEVVPDFNLTVSEQKFAELSEYHLNVGDIIMGRRGEMGRCALIGEKETGWLCGTGSLYIRPFLNNAQSFYLFKYLSSDYIKTYLAGESLGATMPNLNKTIVGNIKVPMPSAEAITKFQKILAADSAYREKITLIDDSLFESLSQKAFSGQL